MAYDENCKLMIISYTRETNNCVVWYFYGHCARLVENILWNYNLKEIERREKTVLFLLASYIKNLSGQVRNLFFSYSFHCGGWCLIAG